jgi:hypothetical protein
MGSGPLRLLEAQWETQGFPSGFEAPALALPIMTRHNMKRVVLFGPHATGEDLGGDEIGLIHKLGRAAGAVYESTERRGLVSKLGREARPDDV